MPEISDKDFALFQALKKKEIEGIASRFEREWKNKIGFLLFNFVKLEDWPKQAIEALDMADNLFAPYARESLDFDPKQEFLVAKRRHDSNPNCQSIFTDTKLTEHQKWEIAYEGDK